MMRPNEVPWFVYLLLCKSGRIYTGVTPVLDRRIKTHLVGRGALFTKMDRPIRVLAAKPFGSKTEALRVERQVKRVSAQHKRLLADLWSQQHPIDQTTQECLTLT